MIGGEHLEFVVRMAGLDIILYIFKILRFEVGGFTQVCTAFYIILEYCTRVRCASSMLLSSHAERRVSESALALEVLRLPPSQAPTRTF